MPLPSLKVALAQVSPEFLDLSATIHKACSVIEEAAKNGADIVIFPETYIAAFPFWSAVIAPIYNHEKFIKLVENSPAINGPEMEAISKAAEKFKIFVSIGLNEKSNYSTGCIWNSNALYDRSGNLINHRRKIAPTFYEKLIWASGDANGLRVTDTEIGKIGMLICGENTNPLARYSLMAEGEQLHISTYPPIWPTRDTRLGGDYDLSEAIRIRAAGHSFEAKAFNAVVAGCLTEEMIDYVSNGDNNIEEILRTTPRGISMVVDPTGKKIGGTSGSDEEISYVKIDLNYCIEPKQFHDVVGSYNRFDIFKLHVDRSTQEPATFTENKSKGLNEIEKSNDKLWSSEEKHSETKGHKK